MRSLTRITLFTTALLLAAAFMPGCEDSLLVAPADSDFLVVANPASLTKRSMLTPRTCSRAMTS